uniref:Uncharacterized protein n=1 Tax=Glossina austeni TaxID=7395 RepID=A0A1A9UW38_GLOAU
MSGCLESSDELQWLFSPYIAAAAAVTAEAAPLLLALANSVVAIPELLFASLRFALLLVGGSILLSESEANGVTASPSPSSVVVVAVVCVVFSSIMGSCDVESFDTKLESPSCGVGLVFSFSVSDSAAKLCVSRRPK